MKIITVNMLLKKRSIGMRRKVFCGLITMFLLALMLPAGLHAAVVGRFSLIRGEVDLLKQGQLPAVAAKYQDGVEPGDVIRTKTKAKAQLTMVDDSVITLAPETRLAIADYQFDPVRVERRAVVRAFRGLVHTVVKRIIKTEEPDFILETHTATIGVRGTNWYTLLAPNFTSAYLAYGTLGISSNLPTVPALLLLKTMQFTQIPRGKQPFLPQALTPEILAMLEKLMDTGLSGSGLEFGLPAAGTGGQMQTPLTLPVSPDQRLKLETIPPTLVPMPQTPVQPGPSHQGPG
jgi:FecR protein